MPIPCSACGSLTPDLALYCQMCGKPLHPAKIANNQGDRHALPIKDNSVAPLKAGLRDPNRKAGDDSPEEIVGVVRNVQRTSESVDGLRWQRGVAVSEQVLSFRVELSNADGEITSYVPIEIRGQLIFGDLADGDRVRFANAGNALRRLERIYDLTTDSYVSAVRPFELVRGAAELAGVVRNLRRSVQSAPKAYPGQAEARTTSLQVLMFRVEVSDAQGQIQRYIQIDMRGVRIRGELAEGDRVRFPEGGNGLYRLNNVYCETTSSDITAYSSLLSYWCGFQPRRAQ
jgi:hypothetical protein